MDFEIYGDSSIYMLTPMTPEAHEFVEEKVDNPDGMLSIPVEHRYISNLTRGILEDGLTASLNGQELYIGNDGSVCIRD